MSFYDIMASSCLGIENGISNLHFELMLAFQIFISLEFLSHCECEGSDEDKGSALFKVFDDDDSGTMDFPEFLMASNALKLRLERWNSVRG